MEGKILIVKSQDVRHHCRFCAKYFMSVGSRNDHERNVHEKLRPHKCDQCGKQFYRKFGLTAHKRKHSADYLHSCRICDKRFKSKLSVKLHMKTHTNDRPFMCEVCGKVFKTLAILEAHHNVHTKQTKYSCVLCEKSYSYRASLFLHMRTHTGHRPYQCKDCNASFIVKSHLTDHMRIHTQERPFECKYCLSTFARKVVLKKHLKTHLRVGQQIDIEEALLHSQSKIKAPSVPPSNKNLPTGSNTKLANMKSNCLDHTVESIILYTAYPVEEKEEVTVVISCKESEESYCSSKDPSVCLDHHSQKVIVENAYDTNYEIGDQELCASKVGKSKENPFRMLLAGESFEGLQSLNEESSTIPVPVVSNVCEVRDTSLDQLPSNCIVYPNKLNVSPSDTDTLASQAVLDNAENVTRISSKYDNEPLNKYTNEPLSEENKLIDNISETDIQGLLSDFDDRHSECVQSTKQISTSEDEPLINECNFESNKSMAYGIKSKAAVCETYEDKKNYLRKCKYCNVRYRYLACLKDHEETHRKRDLQMDTRNVVEDDSLVHLGKVTRQTPLVVDSHLPFTCKICGVGFSFRSELRKHSKLHSQRYSYFCKKCNQAFRQEVFLNRHKCLSSDGSSTLPEQLTDTVDMNKKITQELTCKCRTVIQTTNHLDVNDSRGGNLCNKCGDRDDGSNHEWSHENRSSHYESELEIKENTDETGNKYPLELQFVEETLDHGKQRETGDHSQDSLHIENLCDVIDDMKNVVLVLDKSLSLPLGDCGLEVTAQTDNQDLIKKDSNKLRKFRKGKFTDLLKCKYCPVLFKYNSTLKTHERIHTGEKPFSCSVCNKTFSKKSNMKLHQRIHTGERSFLCDYCGKHFSYKYSLDAHKQLHINELPFMCVICGKGFRYESSRSVHLKRHMGNKAFKCEFCSKAFVSKVEMEDHRRIHTGEKPYQCEDCGRSFSYRHNLVDHHRIHTGHKPYRCNVCNVDFRRWGMLKSHLQKHSNSVNP